MLCGSSNGARNIFAGPQAFRLQRIQMNIEKGTADVNGARLYYEAAGTGHPLIFMHGFGGNHHLWDCQFDFFAAHYRIVCFDMRGFGKSSLPTDTKVHYAEDLKALMHHLKIKSAYIGGQSLGGLVTLRFALTYPDAIDALILVDAGMEGYEWSAPYVASMEAIYSLARKEGLPAARALLNRHPIGAPARANPAASAHLKKYADYSGWHLLNITPFDHHDKTIAGRVHEIKKPALIVIGELDLPDFHGIADHLQRNISKSQKVQLSGVGHVSNLESPEAFNNAVLQFLKECDAMR